MTNPNRKTVALVRVTMTTGDAGDWYNAEVFDGEGHSFAASGSNMVDIAMQHAAQYVAELTTHGVMK